MTSNDFRRPTGQRLRWLAGNPVFGPHGERQFTIEELEEATNHFNETNLLGYGSFGLVYKGLLRDTVVAIKRRPGSPKQEFVTEESGSQMLVFEYLPNGSICSHLYDTGQESSTKLEFKQRLSIALGAAKGLLHLHTLNPPLLHKNFKTANVLVDENFIAKVSDSGITLLLEKIEEAGPSQTSSSTNNVFQDPGVVGRPGTFAETSDVYSFGVFLLELVTGQEAVNIPSLESFESLIQWVKSQLSSNSFVDQRLAGRFTSEGIRDLIMLTLRCMNYTGERRPKMEEVVDELERINEKEMALTTVMGESTTTITLGSELFTSR
ncbi:hypothetical protein ACFE04_013856 [Oxalis oulophora]